MNYSFFSRLRDYAFICMLFYLIKIAYNRNYNFIMENKKSIIHELERDFIDQIYTAQRQTHLLQEHHYDDDAITHATTDIKNRLALIEEKYKTNSPGLILLGPIGSAAIIAKEEQLQQKLLGAINDLTRVCYTINNAQQEFKQAETINNGLENNKKLLQTLVA